MARVTFMDGIASVSGKIGDVVFRKSPSGKTYAYQMRKTPKRIPSEKEKKQRQRFSIITKMVSAIMADPTQRAAYEQLQKDTYGARKMTLRKFVFQKVAATLLPVKDTEEMQRFRLELDDRRCRKDPEVRRFRLCDHHVLQSLSSDASPPCYARWW